MHGSQPSLVSINSLRVQKHVVVVGGYSPVLAVIVLVREVLLVISEESVQLETLLKVLNSFEATNVLEEVEVAVSVDAGTDESVPVNALQLDVRVVDLEVEVEGLREVYVGTFDCVHVFASRLKLIELEVLREHFHLLLYLHT